MHAQGWWYTLLMQTSNGLINIDAEERVRSRNQVKRNDNQEPATGKKTKAVKW